MNYDITTHNMTYGEALQREQDSMTMENGQFKKTITILKPPRLCTIPVNGQSEAGRYYNAKLEKIFAKNLDNNIPKQKREAVVKYLMYGSPSGMTA